MDPVNAAPLLPGLTNDAALYCLARVHFQHFALAKCVCRRWRALFSDKHFFKFRKQKGLDEECTFLLLGNGASIKFYYLDSEFTKCRDIGLIGELRKYSVEDSPRGVTVSNSGIYIIHNDHDVLRFDPCIMKWEKLNRPFELHNHVFAMAGTSDSLFVLAGYDSKERSSNEFQLCSACLFDTQKLTWSDKSAMPQGNHQFTQTFVFDDKVFFKYRFYHDDRGREVLYYDLKDDSWGRYDGIGSSPFEFMAVVGKELYGLHAFHNSLVIARFDVHTRAWVTAVGPAINDVYLLSVVPGKSRILILADISCTLKAFILQMKSLNEFYLLHEAVPPQASFLDAQLFSIFV